ncbi:hypothetical protein PHLCEN_2v9729 [Hermanssonia centrifuga]|uniref:Amino acid permease n=1 Tax=Hermanssonia centrifuga TaxID=98765 RepID=A0A2R6NPX1_9APHY|nr:hypothetical protein PHLCEN_2v9729 [Hermanssonia centrifuga]
MLVGLAMGEVCSAHPTSGGPYYWAAMLSEPRNAPLASWITGWFNLLGQVAVTTGISDGWCIGDYHSYRSFLILGLLFSIQDLDGTVGTATGQPVAQIFLDTVGEKGAIVLMVIVIGAMFFCGTFSVTSNSRMMYAFARDGGIPGHKFFNKVDSKRKSPVRTGLFLIGRLSIVQFTDYIYSSVQYG